MVKKIQLQLQLPLSVSGQSQSKDEYNFDTRDQYQVISAAAAPASTQLALPDDRSPISDSVKAQARQSLTEHIKFSRSYLSSQWKEIVLNGCSVTIAYLLLCAILSKIALRF